MEGSCNKNVRMKKACRFRHSRPHPIQAWAHALLYVLGGLSPALLRAAVDDDALLAAQAKPRRGGGA